MPDTTTLLLLSAAVFAGAFVSGLSGFAFSAVAGAILLRVFQPLEAVPLMMACSIGVQATNLWALRRSIRWEGSLFLIIGGLIGVPIAVSLLQSTDTHLLRRGFGVVVALYAAYMLLRPTLVTASEAVGRHWVALIGFGGGLVGGLTAMPGAIPTIWCDMRGMPKSEQRGLVQPFIAAMQLFAIILLVGHQDLSSKVFVDLAVSLPALFAGFRARCDRFSPGQRDGLSQDRARSVADIGDFPDLVASLMAKTLDRCHSGAAAVMHQRLHAGDSPQQHIEHRGQEQAEHGDADHAREHRDAHGAPHLRAGAGREHQRQHAHDEGH